jgi:hypothetical protein
MTSPHDVGRDKPVGRARVRTTAHPRRGSGLARGTAPPPDVSTRVYHQPNPTPPVFVDSSGRRGHRLRRTAYWLTALAVTLLAVWWLTQVFLAGGGAH